jgi:DNA polymerase III delta prime subunit
MNPAAYTPTEPSEFIGPARTIALMLEAKADALLAEKNPSPVKMLLYGPPGVAKTRLVEMFASRLAWHPSAIESINGRSVTIDTVRRWQESARYIPIGGQFVIKILNEIDTAPSASLDLLLTVFDEAPKHSAFLCTSNLHLMSLSERFETRLQQFRVDAPSTEQIAGFLMKRWGFSERQAMEISVGSGGNVRCACLDAQSILDVERIAA